MSDESIKQEKIELINNRIKKREKFSKFNQDLVSILKKDLEDISKDNVSMDENVLE